MPAEYSATCLSGIKKEEEEMRRIGPALSIHPQLPRVTPILVYYRSAGTSLYALTHAAYIGYFSFWTNSLYEPREKKEKKDTNPLYTIHHQVPRTRAYKGGGNNKRKIFFSLSCPIVIINDFNSGTGQDRGQLFFFFSWSRFNRPSRVCTVALLLLLLLLLLLPVDDSSRCIFKVCLPLY